MSTRMHAKVPTGMTEHEHKARKKPIKVPMVHNSRVETSFWKNKHTPGKYTTQALRELRAKQTAEALEKDRELKERKKELGIT